MAVLALTCEAGLRSVTKVGIGTGRARFHGESRAAYGGVARVIGANVAVIAVHGRFVLTLTCYALVFGAYGRVVAAAAGPAAAIVSALESIAYWCATKVLNADRRVVAPAVRYTGGTGFRVDA